MTKMKKMVVPKYTFKNELGYYDFGNVEILIPVNSEVRAEAFNQEKDEYSISSREIERMGREVALRFFNDNYTNVLTGKRNLTPREVNGIRMFLGCNGSELGVLLGLDKSNISRILNSEQELVPRSMILLMEKMKNEIDSPGTTKALMEKQDKSSTAQEIHDLNLSVIAIAEWIIRKFISLEDSITNLKLQKLLYYAKGIGLGRYNCRLYDSNILAWEYGPVVREVWDKYKGLGSTALPIDQTADLSSLDNNTLALKILNETIINYGRYAAWNLREKTHSERPWRETKKDEVISDDLIEEFFRTQII